MTKNKKTERFDAVLCFMHIFFLLLAILLICNLFTVQILDFKGYKAKGQEQYVTKTVTLRGDIYDRNGIKLATDEIYREVYAHKKYQDKSSKDYNPDMVGDYTKQELAKKLAPILNISEKDLLEKLGEEGTIITLKRGVDRKTETEINKLGLIRDLSVGKKTKRVYPQGTLAAHVLGYHNPNAKISTGIESIAENKLKYTKNLIPLKSSKDGKIIFEFDTNPIETTQIPRGENVTLTIDAAIQHIAERELFKTAKERKADGGFAIVMNPKNGEILAYAVYPYFDPNNYTKATPRELKNWTLTDIYAPGSTFKIVTIASALELGKITKDTKVYDTCHIKVGGHDISNSHCYPSGMISLVDLFERSSNVASYGISQLMTDREFYDMVVKFGFGKKTGFDLKEQTSGLLYPPKYWDKTTKLSMSYGYGTSVNAMQMVSAVGTLANNGVKVTPHVIKYSPEEAKKKITSTQVVSPETAKIVTELLAESIDKGHTTFKLEKYKLAAKTGTSKKTRSDGKGYIDGAYYTSTIGYFPASDPQVLIYVCLDNPKGGNAFGNTIAGPVFKEIAENIARILNIQSDR